MGTTKVLLVGVCEYLTFKCPSLPINIEISKWFLKQSDLPIPPKELHDWAHIHTKLSCTIHDFSLFYDKKNLTIWKSENRKWLLQNAIKQYEMELEELKMADKLI